MSRLRSDSTPRARGQARAGPDPDAPPSQIGPKAEVQPRELPSRKRPFATTAPRDLCTDVIERSSDLIVAPNGTTAIPGPGAASLAQRHIAPAQCDLAANAAARRRRHSPPRGVPRRLKSWP